MFKKNKKEVLAISEEFIVEGKREGAKNKAFKVAMSMIDDERCASEVIKYTELTTDEINDEIKKQKIKDSTFYKTFEKLKLKNNMLDAKNWRNMQGVEMGAERKLNEIALNMLENNETIDEIIKYTDLTEEQITTLKNMLDIELIPLLSMIDK